MVREFRLELGGGEFLVGDELPGRTPAYVYLHGLGSVRQGQKSDSLFAHARSRGRAALRVDQRGHGGSPGHLGEIPVSTLIADAVRLLERTGPAVVVGSSLGGMVATHAAVRRPDLVLGLCLLAPAFGLMANLERRLDAAGRLWTSNGLGFVVARHVLADARALAVEEAGLPARLRVPTFLVHGTADDVVPAASSARFADALRSTRHDLWLVPGGDHRLSEHADAIWPRLDALLAAADHS
ncbi:MAG: alpha/beta fold hydrolase [Planctomycetes bacterium]|nr:alpha/beta fold hydrolase [Planctomycetota bacterium]